MDGVFGFDREIEKKRSIKETKKFAEQEKLKEWRKRGKNLKGNRGRIWEEACSAIVGRENPRI